MPFYFPDFRHNEQIDFFQNLMHNSKEILLQAAYISAVEGDQ